jgi:hypothetical protein
LKEGRGTLLLASGAQYVGEMKAGKYHGHGVFRTPHGDEYEGSYIDGKKDGYGILKNLEGVYKGFFREN